jgi:hypothetical protein
LRLLFSGQAETAIRDDVEESQAVISGHNDRMEAQRFELQMQ